MSGSKKTVLITGGSGFVGANLARRSLDVGHDVHLLLKENHQTWRIQEIERDVVFHEAALHDRTSIDGIMREVKPEWIFHLAAEGSHSWETDGAQILSTNLHGTIAILDAAVRQGFECFINTGSSSEYGFKDHAPSEEEILEPNSVYAISKAAATHYCELVARRTGHKIPTLRLYSVCGPWEDPRRLIPRLIDYGLNGSFPPLTPPEVSHDFVFIEDVVDAYLKVAEGSAAGSMIETGNQVFNVGSCRQLSLETVVSICRNVFKINEEAVWGSMPNRAWDSNNWCADSRKIYETTGWLAKIPFEEGFRTTVEWQSKFGAYNGFDLLGKTY